MFMSIYLHAENWLKRDTPNVISAQISTFFISDLYIGYTLDIAYTLDSYAIGMMTSYDLFDITKQETVGYLSYLKYDYELSVGGGISSKYLASDNSKSKLLSFIARYYSTNYFVVSIYETICLDQTNFRTGFSIGINYSDDEIFHVK